MAKKRQVRWGWIGVGSLLVLAIIVGIGSEMTKKIPVRGAEAVEGKVEAYVEERARTSLPHIYHITMPMEGRIMPIHVEEGDTVIEGQMVARIDDVEWRENSIQAGDIVIAMKNWVKAAEGQVTVSKIRQDFTKWDWDKNKKLLKEKAISERQERDARSRYLDSNVKVEESQAMYHASEAFNSIVAMLPFFVNRKLDRTIVKSPVSGTVLKRHVSNEKVITSGSPLLDIGNFKKLEVTADVLTEEAVRIQMGDRVEIFGETIGDKPIMGKIRLVEPEAFKKISSLGVEEQRVAVKIAFEKGVLDAFKESGRTLGLSYRVRVRVITDEKANVIRIPRTALFKGIEGDWQVYRIENDQATLTPVKVGLLNDRTAEIISGVKAGEVVIVAPESSIAEGTRVSSMNL